ncbi:MAG: hypothetical protein K9M45_08390 [Kiritimatiellales bacterium]|nr:hypothetical protein [Kiritimatiellales bacterium]
MQPVDIYGEAWEGIRNGFESGRMAHAYLIVGSPRGNALRFCESVLQLLFCESEDKPCKVCNGCQRVELHKHVDILWIEPQSKSRQIKADDIRALVSRMAMTSYEGGWKAGVVVSADCMNDSSANVLLKTLEEPPKKSILFLITDSPQTLLPTIISRCQRIVLPSNEGGAMEELWRDPLREIMRSLPPANGLDAGRLSNRLKAVLDLVKNQIAELVEEDAATDETAIDEAKQKEILDARINARLLEVQSGIFRTMLDWHRDLLMLVKQVDASLLIFPDELAVMKEQAAKQSVSSALRNIDTIESMPRRINRNIPVTQVLDEALRNLMR